MTKRKPKPNRPVGTDEMGQYDIAAISSAVIEGFLAAACRRLGLDMATVKALDPRRGATGSQTWRTHSHARQLAIYLANQATGLPSADLARAAGVTPAAVSIALKAVEDCRDDPTFDALVAEIERDVTGRAS